MLPPERAQKVAELALKMRPIRSVLRSLGEVHDTRLNTQMGGMEVPNPVGLAAGYDKDCKLVNSLATLGFGYIVAGTVVSELRNGNPRPRIVRNSEEGSLVNSLGFPSEGLEVISKRLERNSSNKVPLILSIAGLTIEEFSRCYKILQPLVSGIELNISSPNTKGIRVFQEPNKLEELLSSLRSIKEKPLFLKLPPYFDDIQKSRVMELVGLCIKYSVDGVTTVNTWPVEDNRLALGQGGLSGKPLYPHMIRIVEDVRNYAGDRFTINACGGIFSGEGVVNAFKAGANTVQLFTGFIYEGPGLMKKINRHLLAFLEKEDIPTLAEVTKKYLVS